MQAFNIKNIVILRHDWFKTACNQNISSCTLSTFGQYLLMVFFILNHYMLDEESPQCVEGNEPSPLKRPMGHIALPRNSFNK